MAAAGEGHGWLLDAVEAYEAPLTRYARRLLDDFDLAAVAAFGMLLRDSEFKGDATFATVARLAAAALGPDSGGYRAEFLDLVRRAESLRSEPDEPARGR